MITLYILLTLIQVILGTLFVIQIGMVHDLISLVKFSFGLFLGLLMVIFINIPLIEWSMFLAIIFNILAIVQVFGTLVFMFADIHKGVHTHEHTKEFHQETEA